MNDHHSPGPLRRVHFGLCDLPEQLAAFAATWPDARACAQGRSFTTGLCPARLWLPFAAPRVEPLASITDYAAGLGAGTGRQVVLLLRAGAMALGYWDGDELLVHKALRKYVVRGHGHAQPTHLKTRGKSRYGARLRLQNWRRLLVETNQRLQDCWRDLGAPDRTFYAAPVRVWVDLLATAPAPPFARDDRNVQRLPVHVHRPDFEELQRIRGWLVHGRLELPEQPPGPDRTG